MMEEEEKEDKVEKEEKAWCWDRIVLMMVWGTLWNDGCLSQGSIAVKKHQDHGISLKENI